MAKKATKREPETRSRGSIQARGADTWLIRVYVGKDEGTGKRQYHNETVKGTRKAAEKALTKVLRDLDTNQYVAPARDTLKATVAAWGRSKKTGVTPRTFYNYQSLLKTSVLPALGEKKIDRITGMDIQGVIDAAAERGLSSGSVRNMHTACNLVFQQAVAWGLLSSNPCAGIKLPKRTKSPAKALTVEDTQKILQATKGDRLHALWVLLLTTGLRPGEALALRWEDVRITEDNGRKVGTLSISRNVRVDPANHHRPYIDDPKTEAGVREVVMFSVAIEALEAHRLRQLKARLRGAQRAGEEDLVFPSRVGRLQYLTNVRGAWKKALESAGVAPIRLYDQRHTHITQMVDAGENIKVVAERVGHADPNITLKVYTHVTAGMQKAAVESAEKKLGFAV